MRTSDLTKVLQFKKTRPAGVLIVTSILILAGFFVYIAINNNSPSTKLRQKKDGYISQALQQHDYTNYQDLKIGLITTDLQKGDYTSATKEADAITYNVPSNKINTQTYVTLSEVYSRQSDKTKYRKYTVILISQLRQEGSNEEANYYQTQLDKVE